MLKSFAFMNPFLLSSQPDFPGGGMASGSKTGATTKVPGENVFAMLLANMNSGKASAGNSHAKPSFETDPHSAGAKTAIPTVRPNANDPGFSYAAALESAFRRQGIFPDTVSLSRDDMDYLATILEKMGLSRAGLRSFFQAMKENRSGDRITLAHFLKDLTGFEQAGVQKPEHLTSLKTDSLDKSAIPHLELILRELGISPEKMEVLLSASARKTGAIDIQKLVFQLKSQMDSKAKNPVELPIAKDSRASQLNLVSIQRVASGLEKLGLSVPDKAGHQSVTLEMFVQALEKKVQKPVPDPKTMPMTAARMSESVLEMPAVKSMKAQEAGSYFGFAREMMLDRQNKKPSGNRPGSQPAGSQNLLSANKDAAIARHPTPDPRISTADVSKAKNPVELPIAKDSRASQLNLVSIQRVASGLEKLGLSVPDKAGHQSVTLEMFVQALEKKVQKPVPDPKTMPMTAARMSESVLEMPAVKAMKAQEAGSYFGFAREMMLDRQNKKPSGNRPGSQPAGSQNLLSANKDPAIARHPTPDPRISTADVSTDNALRKPDADRRPVRTDVFRQDSEKRISDHKADTQSRPVPMDISKQDTEKGNPVYKLHSDSSPVPTDISKTDGAVRQEIQQNQMAGGERVYQGTGLSFANVPEGVSPPGKPLGVPQQVPLPAAAVVNQVGKEIAAFLHRGDRFFTLQLKPPELGMVNIEMDVKENVLKMSVVAETSSAKDMLQANYVNLKRVLEGYGIRVETFDVQLNNNLNQTASNGDGLLNQQHHSHGRFGKNVPFGKSAGETPGEDNTEEPVLPETNKEALLDLLA